MTPARADICPLLDTDPGVRGRCVHEERAARRKAARAGMTLMEIMIVITLMAALVSLVAYGIGFLGQADTRSEALRISSVIRYVYNTSATQNRTLQMVINLDDGKITVDDLDVGGAMTREQLMGSTLVTEQLDEEDKGSKRGSRLDEEDQKFANLQRTTLGGPLLGEEESALAEGVFVIGVMTSHHEEMQTEGIATINFFPSGFVERAIIYLGNEEARGSEDQGIAYTLMINSLTGQSTVRPGRVPIEDRFFDLEDAD